MKLRTDLPPEQAKRQLLLDYLNRHGECEAGVLAHLLGERRRTTSVRLQRMAEAGEVTRRYARIGRTWGYYFTAVATVTQAKMPLLSWEAEQLRLKQRDKPVRRKSTTGHYVNDIDTRGPHRNQGGQGAIVERRRTVGEII